MLLVLLAGLSLYLSVRRIHMKEVCFQGTIDYILGMIRITIWIQDPDYNPGPRLSSRK